MNNTNDADLHIGKYIVLKKATVSQTSMMLYRDKYTKKVKLRYCQDHMTCGFCGTDGHSFSMCLARPTTPSWAEREKFVDHLCEIPQIDTAIYKDLSLPAVLQKLFTLADVFNEENPWKGSLKPRDAMRKNLGLWKAIGSNISVLTWVAYGLCLRFHTKPEPLDFPSPPMKKEHREACEKAANNLIKEGKMWAPEPGFAKLISPQIVDEQLNSDGSLKERVCDALIYLNSLLASHKYKLETLKRFAPEIVRRFDLMFALDYKGAYKSVWMHKSALPYLCLRIEDKVVSSLVLPFGLKPAGFWFTKMNRPIVIFFRAVSLRLLNYLDDWLFSSDPKRVYEALHFSMVILVALGFSLNHSKQCDPATSVKALGFVVNSISLSYEVPKKKEELFKAMVLVIDEEFRNGNKITNRTVQRVTSTAISLKLAAPEIMIFVKPVFKAINYDPDCAEGPSLLNDVSMQALLSLPDVVSTFGGRRFFRVIPVATLEVDTSVSGIGSHFTSDFEDMSLEASFPLPESVIGKSSTYRELFGAWVMLEKVVPYLTDLIEKSDSPQPEGINIRVVIDSTSSIFALLKPGSNNPEINEVVGWIYSLLRKHLVLIEPEWRARELLQHVDDLSKKWEELGTLSEKAWLMILRAFPKYGVKFPNPNTLPSAIWKAAHQKSTVIVHPEWTGERWWPLLASKRSRFITIGPYKEAFKDEGDITPTWSFQASLFLKNNHISQPYNNK